MNDIYLFGLSSRRAEWLSQRQGIVAENVANADTPAYVAKDVSAFGDTMQATRLAMAGTDPLHLSAAGGRSVDVEARPEASWDVSHSGNSVSLEQEMLKAGEVQSGFSLNSAIAKAFQRFYLMGVKG